MKLTAAIFLSLISLTAFCGTPVYVEGTATVMISGFNYDGSGTPVEIRGDAAKAFAEDMQLTHGRDTRMLFKVQCQKDGSSCTLQPVHSAEALARPSSRQPAKRLGQE